MARHRRYCGPPDPICSQRPASRSTSAQDLHQGICEPRQRLSFPSGTLPGRSCSLWRRVRLRRFWASPASPAVRIAWKGPGSGGIDPTDDGDTRVAARARHKAGLSLAPRNPPSRSETRWSERQDLNLRPPVPQTDALPGCATLRRRGRTIERPVDAGNAAMGGAVIAGSAHQRSGAPSSSSGRTADRRSVRRAIKRVRSRSSAVRW